MVCADGVTRKLRLDRVELEAGEERGLGVVERGVPRASPSASGWTARASPAASAAPVSSWRWTGWRATGPPSAASAPADRSAYPERGRRGALLQGAGGPRHEVAPAAPLDGPRSTT